MHLNLNCLFLQLNITITMKFNCLYFVILCFFLNACKTSSEITPKINTDVSTTNEIVSDSTKVKKANLQFKQSSEKIESNSLSNPTPKTTGARPKKK